MRTLKFTSRLLSNHFGLQLMQTELTKNFVNEKKGKSRCSNGERILKGDRFIAGNSNPAVVPLAAVIFNHKIVFK